MPVFLLGTRAEMLRPLLWGLAIGLMGVASISGLLLPALDEGSAAEVAAGAAAGVVFLLATRRLLSFGDPQVSGLRGAGVRRSLLVFAVLLVHSLPEGFAIGAAFASDTSGLALFVFLAIALQNIPEGTSVAIPMEAAGLRTRAAVRRGRAHQRAAAPGGGDRLPRGRAGHGSAPRLAGVRGRGDAGAGRWSSSCPRRRPRAAGSRRSRALPSARR